MAAGPSDPGGKRLPRTRGSRLRLPRVVYWLAGAAIAGSGAVFARHFAELYPAHRILLWLTGAAVIFVGLAVLSLGTRARLEPPREDAGSQ